MLCIMYHRKIMTQRLENKHIHTWVKISMVSERVWYKAEEVL